MEFGMHTVIYPVADLASAKRLYSALLGVAPYMDTAYYVGYQVGGQEVGLDPHGHSKGLAGPLGYWHVDDITARLQQLVDAGGVVQQAITEVGGGKRIAHVRDADGNLIGLLQRS
jgi:predicted enzyme related to lactoylglutathione lyase